MWANIELTKWQENTTVLFVIIWRGWWKKLINFYWVSLLFKYRLKTCEVTFCVCIHQLKSKTMGPMETWVPSATGPAGSKNMINDKTHGRGRERWHFHSAICSPKNIIWSLAFRCDCGYQTQQLQGQFQLCLRKPEYISYTSTGFKNIDLTHLDNENHPCRLHF